MKLNKPVLISVVGPTAVGKTALAIDLAVKLETEIISADSRQFFQEMSVGTAKPSDEELSTAPHHFINTHSVSDTFSAGEFGRQAIQKIRSLHEKYSSLITVGGSTLYLKAIWEGFDEMPEVLPNVRIELNEELEKLGLPSLLKELKEKDPEYYQKVDQNNGQRVVRALEVIRSSNRTFTEFRKKSTQDLPYQNLKIGLDMDRELLFEKINYRVDIMIENGLFEEVESLIDFRNHNALQTVGYKEVFDYLDGAYDREEAIRLIKRNTRRYAKRQLTWFRKYDDIHWFKPNQIAEILKLIDLALPKT